jgi:hypothetical protein
MSKRRPLLGSSSGILGDVPGTSMPNPYLSPAANLLNPANYKNQPMYQNLSNPADSIPTKATINQSKNANSLLGESPLQKQPKLSTAKSLNSSSLLGDGPPSMEKRPPLIPVSDHSAWGYGDKQPAVQQSNAQPIVDGSTACGSFRTSVAPLITTDQPSSTKFKVDEDTHSLKQLGNKVRDAFNSETSSTNPKPPLNSILLDGKIVYRNEQNSIACKTVNLQLLALNSDKITNQTLTIANGFPEKRIIALPIELNPTAIDHCLSYIHGNSIILNGSLDEEESLEDVSKIYITALYLELSGLVNKINVMLNSGAAYASLKKNLDFSGMNEFVKSLPEPEIFSVNPVDIDDLPCSAVNKQD